MRSALLFAAAIGLLACGPEKPFTGEPYIQITNLFDMGTYVSVEGVFGDPGGYSDVLAIRWKAAGSSGSCTKNANFDFACQVPYPAANSVVTVTIENDHGFTYSDSL